MITFLPTEDFVEVARCLDDKRLGAQRYEAWSILKWLRNPDKYPSLVRAGYCSMWAGYERALVKYTNAMLCEWANRGKNNNLLRPYDKERELNEDDDSSSPPEMPPWLGAEELHSYHRHALVSKQPEHYGGYGWTEDGSAYNGSYLWPVRIDGGEWILRWPKSNKAAPVPLTGLKRKRLQHAAESIVNASEKKRKIEKPKRQRRRSHRMKLRSDKLA